MHFDFDGGKNVSALLAQERESGLKCITRDVELEARLSIVMNRVFELFSDLIERKTLAGFFLWDSDKNTGSYAPNHFCAVTVLYGIGKNQWAYAIGFSLQMKDYSDYDFQLVVLHEFAHLLAWANPGHPPHWHAFLNWMLDQYNAKYGTELKNDYDQFNDEGVEW